MRASKSILFRLHGNKQSVTKPFALTHHMDYFPPSYSVWFAFSVPVTAFHSSLYLFETLMGHTSGKY